MDINGTGPRPDVTAVTTAPRATPTPVRTRFSEVMAKTVVSGAESALRALPGGPMMAVALRGAGASATPMSIPRPFAGGNAALVSPEGPGAAGAGGIGGVAGSGLGGAGAAAGATGDGGIESSLQQSQQMNMYYLQIQEEVNAQNRSFTTLSNVLKAEHDTVKTAIGNVR